MTTVFLVRGEQATVRIEQNVYQGMSVRCRWPRQTQFFDNPPPGCDWRWPEWDEAEMFTHAVDHLRKA